MTRNIGIKIIAIILMITLNHASMAQIDIQAVSTAIDQQMLRYPESTLRDIYKSFFQDAFGPGHLMPEGEKARQMMAAYLENECETMHDETSLCPDYEAAGWQGRFYRVSLSVITDGRVPFDKFLSAFMRSASNFTLPDISEWQAQWNEIERIVREKELGLPHFEEDSAAIKELLESGRYASHHSEEYNAAYHPHYRLIEKEIFNTELLPLIEQKRAKTHGKKRDSE
ncbi:MAG: hypothetical protein ACI358_05775 [Candidatus Limimorpha sp.]